MTSLTAGDARAFLDTVNRGRKAFDFDPLDNIDGIWEVALPGDTKGCLSYHALIGPIGMRVDGGSVGTVQFYVGDASDVLAAAIGGKMEGGAVTIPDSILRVTNVFDLATVNGGALDEVRDAFRAAGLLDREPVMA